MKIAFCVTTRNRKQAFENCLFILQIKPPENSRIFIVDDASDEPFSGVKFSNFGITTHRFEKNVGIARAKNKCLEMAYDWGADHIFLLDDDVMPLQHKWWEPYINHPEPHLMLQFKLPGKPDSDMRELYRDDKTVAYSHTRGAMIYVERRVLDVVGGFDIAYGKAGYEHPDFTNRIHNAGLTTHRAMDVPGSDLLLYCLDKSGSISSTIKGIKSNYRLYRSNLKSKEYKEFRSEQVAR